ncbi:MAG: hypothetical protein KDJ20_19355 [Hyphomicrobiales bacterium]|nr:hypothetical protein [Hyphomicrobiales bacterium]
MTRAPARDDWRGVLAAGAITCRVSQDDAPVAEWAPTGVEELWAPIRIHETGTIGRGEIGAAYRTFVESGAAVGDYAGEACETIVKFGSAIQFRQAFVVRFSRSAK